MKLLIILKMICEERTAAGRMRNFLFAPDKNDAENVGKGLFLQMEYILYILYKKYKYEKQIYK